MGLGGGFSCEALELKEGHAVLRFRGPGALAALAPEAGGHRVQQVPPTDKKGRVHSSTVTVAVLPEPRASELRLEPRDLRFETYRASGPGGQHRNTTESAVRVTHLPTGVQAQSAEERSQGRNKALALAALRARLAEQAQRAGRRQRNRQRREQVGRGRRADKVRTLAYQRGRVEDHRSGKRLSIRRFERGELEELH